MDNKLREIEEIVESYYAGNYIPVTPASWYFERFRLCLSTIKRLTEERDVYKKGYYKDADAVTLTVVSRLESEVKRLTEENERQDKIIRATISGEYYDQINSLLRQKDDEIQSLNKRYLEEFEKTHD